MSLPEFLDQLARRRWEWGMADCLISLSDWVFAKRGIDPAAKFRGAYSTEAECEAVLKAHGGMLRVTGDALAAHGFARTQTPVAGDVGIVLAPVRSADGSVADGLVGGICAAPERWAIVTPDKGLVIAPMRVVAAWRV